MYSSSVLNPQVSQLAGQMAAAVQALVTQMSPVTARTTSTSTHHRPRSHRQAAEDKHKKAFANVMRELGVSQLEADSMERISALPLCPPAPLPSHWSHSHASAPSFYENKYGMSEEEMRHSTLAVNRSGILITSGILGRLHNGQLYTISQRGFKTKRAPTGREFSEPSGRLKSLVMDAFKDRSPGSSQQHHNAHAPSSSTHSPAPAPEMPAGLLDDPTLTGREREKLQIAFSEGYVAAQSRGEAGGGRRARGTYLYPLFLVVSGFILFTVFSSVGRDIFGQDLKSSLLRRPFESQPEHVTVTFADVRGVDEAKEELQDVVDFLRSPDKFQALGARLPKGVLLVGPPGIGKTLLARAVAGEAQVPFFHASGSEFDEMFVGTGARRVRQLFESAKAHAPCVIFLDEIDSVGAKRTSSQMHPYANQTINQLLSEMDGFRPTEGIIVLGATNRKDNLDKAILRPGRFDVEISVTPPDLKGRMEILHLYLERVRRAPDLDVERLARGTIGFSGADLQNLVNQAALNAAKEGATVVNMVHLEFARDKLLMGPAKKNKVPDHETNLNTAYHEAGHALVAHFTKDANPINKITIIARGPSLGHTSFIPEKEMYQTTRAQLLAEIDTLMGGRVAEELINGNDQVTTGAGSDIQRATAIATAMVKQYGMSARIGCRVISDNQRSMDGLNIMAGQETSEQTTAIVDTEIKKILDESYERARAILTKHSEAHKALAQALMLHETLDAAQVRSIVDDGKLPPPPPPPTSSPATPTPPGVNVKGGSLLGRFGGKTKEVVP